jgi:hypothetical protein
MKRINFTTEHQSQLKEWAIDLLFSGTFIKGFTGASYSVFDLLHNVTINTLVTMLGNLKKDIEKIENLDEWSMTDYQQKRLAESKKMAEFLNLAIGWRKYNEQVAEEKEQVKALKAKMKELKTSTMTPTEQIAELEKQITSMGGSLTEDTE